MGIRLSPLSGKSSILGSHELHVRLPRLTANTAFGSAMATATPDVGVSKHELSAFAKWLVFLTKVSMFMKHMFKREEVLDRGSFPTWKSTDSLKRLGS